MGVADESDLEESELLVNGFVEGHPNRRFSAKEVAQSTGLHHDTCLSLLKKHLYVRQVRQPANGRGQAFVSIAPPLEPTLEGMQEAAAITSRLSDELGRQAREDFYYLVHERSRPLRPKKYRTVRKF